MITKALMIGDVLWRNQFLKKFICFGAYGVNVFQGNKCGVTKQIHGNYVFHFIGVHYMAHHTNLAMQTLLRLILESYHENLLQTFHSYFAHAFLKKT